MTGLRLSPRFPPRGGNRPSLLLRLPLLLQDLWHICKNLLNPTILLTVAKILSSSSTDTAIAAPLSLVLVTREVTACPYTKLHSPPLRVAFLTDRPLTQAGWTVLRVLRVFPAPALKR